MDRDRRKASIASKGGPRLHGHFSGRFRVRPPHAGKHFADRVPWVVTWSRLRSEAATHTVFGLFVMVQRPPTSVPTKHGLCAVFSGRFAPTRADRRRLGRSQVPPRPASPGSAAVLEARLRRVSGLFRAVGGPMAPPDLVGSHQSGEGLTTSVTHQCGEGSHRPGEQRTSLVQGRFSPHLDRHSPLLVSERIPR